MPDYDFHQLSPYDLEILARDLLQVHWGVTIESFKTGRDSGIDLRHAEVAGKTIVQVKHYARTGLNGLLRELKKEAAKVRRLQPTRYVLVTSVSLTPLNKEAIASIIGEDLLKPSDVIGCEDINNLLGQHEEVERGHYKLWLASKAVLDRVLNNAAMTRSEFKVRQVYGDVRRYVPSNAYPDALRMLSDQRVVIVAGPPGVGKTTLANLLLYEHLERGFQAVLIQRDIEEGQNLFQQGVPQVFYFDDFMGATFLGDRTATANGTGDRAILDFIAMVRATPSARLILTTREHIYTQALNRSERLRFSDLDDLRVILHMPSYSFQQKARILYNHLYFSDLPLQYQDDLLRDDFYLQIIKHKKFNPRLIEWLSSFRRIRTIPLERYRGFVRNLLADPSEIWRHAYEQEITDAGRSLLLTLFSLGGRVGEWVLRSAFDRLHQERSRRYGFETRPEDLRTALREIAGTFIKPFGSGGIEVIDPSVLDLMNAIVRTAPDNAVDIFEGAAVFDQIERMWSLAKAEGYASILDTLRHEAPRVAESVATRMMDGRRIDMGRGSVGYRGATFERRLIVLVDMADRLSSPAFAALISPLFERLCLEWTTEGVQINDATDLLRALDSTQSIQPPDLARIKADVERGLLEEVRAGCRSDELREFVGVIDISANPPALSAARAAFESLRTSFADELRECRSVEAFESLADDLELFKAELGVDIDTLLERVEETKAEFEGHQDSYADQMQDEYKDRWRDERANERGVSEMFGSLKGGRN